jgi:hypothetical protein
VEDAAGAPVRPRGAKRRFLRRWSRRLLALFVAIGAGVFITVFTIDIGRVPWIKDQAENTDRSTSSARSISARSTRRSRPAISFSRTS